LYIYVCIYMHLNRAVSHRQTLRHTDTNTHKDTHTHTDADTNTRTPEIEPWRRGSITHVRVVREGVTDVAYEEQQD